MYSPTNYSKQNLEKVAISQKKQNSEAMKNSPQKILVGIDRDNTIIRDDEGYFGSKDNWREEMRLVEAAVEGLKMLSRCKDLHLVVISSQVGVAKGVLTEQRVFEIHRHLDQQLNSLEVRIDTWLFSPFVLEKDSDTWLERGITTVRSEYVIEEGDPRCNKIKPGIGLLEEAAADLNLDWDDLSVWVIGDRLSDVETGLNAGGKGILINSPNIVRGNSPYDEISQIEVLEKSHPDRVFECKNLSDAAGILLRAENRELVVNSTP